MRLYLSICCSGLLFLVGSVVLVSYLCFHLPLINPFVYKRVLFIKCVRIVRICPQKCCNICMPYLTVISYYLFILRLSYYSYYSFLFFFLLLLLLQQLYSTCSLLYSISSFPFLLTLDVSVNNIRNILCKNNTFRYDTTDLIHWPLISYIFLYQYFCIYFNSFHCFIIFQYLLLINPQVRG